tara:strand:- start:2986 stop:4338 length:1353 start_codon:yes stop_codon:yes gene_type:complete
MYLISVEGGDGSGKGEAVRILATLANRLAFPNVHVTHEPRRHSELGKLALRAVSKGEHTPLQEAGLFAADRVDHSHTWIRPRLLKGDLVISDRNIHSSLVYQGVVGKLGLKQVAKMNAAAMIPDLVIWIDCDPAKAMKRINSGTLRMAGEKHEYFETTEIQTKIRAGFRGILSGEIETPAPFSRSIIIGPVLNEGGLDDLERQLSQALSTFFNRRLEPLNVNRDEVDRHLLKSLTTGVQTQQKLPGAPSQHISLLEDWLDGKSPAQWMQLAEDEWDEKRARTSDVPGRPIAHSSWAILGTLSLTDTTDVPSLHRQLGPVRSVTKRHTQRLVKWMEQERWIHRQQSHVPFAEAQMFKLRKSRLGYGRLCLAMWPLRIALASWRRSNPESDWANALSEIIQSTDEKKVPLQIRNAVKHVIERLNLISSGHAECPVPQNEEELVIWWATEPPQ